MNAALLWIVVSIVMMSDVEAFAPLATTPGVLVPSQILSSSSRPMKTHRKGIRQRQPMLVPSQVVSSKFPSSFELTAHMAAAEEELVSKNSNQTTAPSTATLGRHHTDSRRSRRRKRPLKKKAAALKKETRVYDQYPTTGNLPDPWYRAIPMEHLRQHPRFQSLAPIVTELPTLEDVSRFRQESWQWDALHAGRCTTSQAAAALGFLDPTPAQVLNIPNSWRKGASGAFRRLSQQPVLRTLEDMRRTLLETSSTSTSPDTDDDESSLIDGDLWEETGETVAMDDDNTPTNATAFAAEYMYEPTPEEFKERRKYIKERSGGDYLPNGIRLIWGNTQEATAVLTVLNYFAANDPDLVVKESGMCGAGLALNQTDIESSLLVGATPDAVLCHGDGRLEVLEVKNHCPFFSNANRKRRGGKLKNFSIGDRPLGEVGVMSQYIPQLQLEMYCLGPACQSAVMVRQTATQGAVLLRMMRDDEWIEEMLYFLHRFQKDYVEARKQPRADFFWQGKESTRYRRFVHRTIQVRDKVKVIATLPNENIQRGSSLAPFFLD